MAVGDDDNDDDDLDLSASAWMSRSPDGRERNESRGLPVSDSEELTRVLNLPRRAPVIEGSATAEAYVAIGMQKYARVRDPQSDMVAMDAHLSGDFVRAREIWKCRCREIDPARFEPRVDRPPQPCLARLLWIQGWALYELEVAGGLLAAATVGIGKCVHSDTEVFDYQAGRRRLAAEPGALRVATYTRTLQIADARAFPSGRKECTRVLLRDGTELIVSTDHPILTARGWVDAGELQCTDFVAVATQMPVPEVTTNATDDEVAFVAYMLADGRCTQRRWTFTNMTELVISDWIRCSRALGYGVSEVKSRSRAREFRLRTGRARDPVRSRWNLHGLATRKRAHADVWGLPSTQVALFLNRFWACDGHVSEHALEITLASEKLIDDLRFLLLRLGVRSRKHKIAAYVKDGERHKFPAWRLTITGANALRFLIEVGDILGKESACKALKYRLETTAHNTNFDVVPVGQSEMQEICTELGIPARGQARTAIRKYLNQTNGQYLSRTKFREFCMCWNYRGKYAHLATTDVAWERVKTIASAGSHAVYDLSVPGTHNFVANGAVIHNTMIGVLAPLALRSCKVGLLLIQASLVDQIEIDYQLIAEHFRVPGLVIHQPGKKTWRSPPRPSPHGGAEPMLHVLPYTRLSSTKSSDWIDRLRPSAVIADEVDSLKSLDSARTRRVARYMSENWRTTRFCGWTGSLTDSSISEFSHLAAWALRAGSPMPLRRAVVDEWGRCLDAVPSPAPPGALIRLLEPGDGASMRNVRRAFRRRLAETPGFVMVGGRQVIVTSSGEEVALEISEREAPPIPQKVQDALAIVRKGRRPDTLVGGERDDIFEDPMQQVECARDIATGIMHRWIFPKREQHPLIPAWYEHRKNWFSELRQFISCGNLHLDSPALGEAAAKRAWGDIPRDANLPEWRAEHWPKWRDIRYCVEPVPKAERLDSFLVDDAVCWAIQNNGIVWYAIREFAAWMQERARELHGVDIPVFGAGSGKEIIKEFGNRAIIASLEAHGRGRDRLQFSFDTQLMAQIPASDRRWTQVLARLHRRGQQSSAVSTFLYQHTKEIRDALDQAFRRGEYVEGITGESRKLLEGWRR